MNDVPAACLPLANQLRDKQSEYDARFLDWDVVSSPGEKADLQRLLDALLSEIDALSIQLKGCITVNGPPPDPATTPSLSIVGIEIVQSIQTVNNRIPVVDGPAVVRVRVDSGIRNNFDAGAGPNCGQTFADH